MPMDPYFQVKLREQRSHVLGEARDKIRGSLGRIRLFGARDAPTETDSAIVEPAAAAAKPAAGPRRGTPAWERRNAQRWDRKLHGQVGIDGPDIPTREFHVPAPGFPDVRVRLYLPPGPGPHPAFLTFFGGAFHLGGIDYASVDAANRRRCAEAAVAVLAVDYALAPDHRFPTPVEQGYAALNFLFQHAEEWGIRRDAIAIGGTSSGGNIAAAVTLLNRSRARHPLRFQLLEVPTTDLTGGHVDFWPVRRMGIPRVLAAREMKKIRDRYLAHPAQARTELASPLLAADHAGLPPAHILTAEYDALRGDGRSYAWALRTAGVDAEAVQYQGATHDAAMYTAVVPLARRWHADVIARLASLHDPER